MNIKRINDIQMDIIKKIFITLGSALLALLEPVHNIAYMLIFLFVANLLVGLFHDLVINKKCFCFRKFIWAFFEFLVYICIICSIYIIGFIQGDVEEFQYIIKVISYLFVYAYSTNISKNLVKIRPDNIVFRYIYHAVSFEFVKKIPFFEEFINIKNNSDEKNR